MDRNPERHERIPLICKNMCEPFYREAFRDFNPNIKLERKKSKGKGDKVCEFHFISLE